MPFEGKDEQLCVLDEVVARVLLFHSFGPSKSISGHDSESIQAADLTKPILTLKKSKTGMILCHGCGY